MEVNKRWIENKHARKDTLQEVDLQELEDSVLDLMMRDWNNFVQKIQPEEKRALCSLEEKTEENFSIFDGAGGYLTLYIKLIQFLKRKEQLPKEDQDKLIKIMEKSPSFQKFTEKELIARAESSLKGCLEVLQKQQTKSKYIDISYFIGSPGLHLNACYLNYFKNDAQSFKQHVDEILKVKNILIKHRSKYPHEILYGVSGYLYCLIELQQNFQQESTPNGFRVNLEESVRDILEILIEDGLEHWGDELNLNSPPKDFRLRYTFMQKEYFGAAHGLIGILYILMRAYQLNKEFLKKETESFAQAIEICIKYSIEYFIKFQLPSGNFPTYEKKKHEDYLVQFCHGAPGAIPCLLQAADVFKDDKSLSKLCADSAEKASECVWNFGILKKGFGLCHGVPGSAFAFLTMYRYTANPVWLQRAYQFILVKKDEECCKIIENFDFSLRLKTGTSDYPYSIMMGLAGDICCASESIFPDSARFPGYEV